MGAGVRVRDGAGVGVCVVGRFVGVCVGTCVGRRVGECVGVWVEGIFVGVSVGVGVGWRVGAGVGVHVPSQHSHSCAPIRYIDSAHAHAANVPLLMGVATAAEILMVLRLAHPRNANPPICITVVGMATRLSAAQLSNELLPMDTSGPNTTHARLVQSLNALLPSVVTLGNKTRERDVQPANAPDAMCRTVLPKFTECNAVQSRKAESPIRLTSLVVNVMLASDVHAWNVDLGIIATLCGIEILVSAVHCSKTPDSIAVMLFDNRTDVRAVQPLNAAVRMNSTLSDMVTCCKDTQSANAWEETRRTMLGILICRKFCALKNASVAMVSRASERTIFCTLELLKQCWCMTCTESGIRTETSPVVLANAQLPMLTTVSGIVMDPNSAQE